MSSTFTARSTPEATPAATPAVPLAIPAAQRSLAAPVSVALLLAALLILPLVFSASPFALTATTLVLLSAIGASSLNLIIRTGHISLAHAGFMGIAAYTCVLAEMRLGWSFLPAMLLGCAASAAVAAVIGPIVLRLTGKYFVLVTFLLGEIVRLVFVEWSSLTGGSNGIQDLPAIHPVFKSPVAFYYLALAAAVICVGICWRLMHSEIGRAIDSVREAERVAECSGVPVIRLKVVVFIIACALVGVQGALQAHFLKFIDPTAFSSEVSLYMVVMNVIGGMYHVAGPLIGTVFMVALPEALRSYVELQRVIFGVILIVVMAALPGGIVGVLAHVRRAMASRSKEDVQ
jgi:branched-chain amino acid transport system permease protein